jgi:broad specificity polyphosphatase/5'/3'-nucleotidase SurE
MSSLMKLLVVTSEPITAEQLRAALPAEVDPTDAEVMVVAPALQQSGIRFWFSDVDDAIARAQQVRTETVEQLGEAGVSASGDTGDSDPMQAIEDAVNIFSPDRILIFSHGDRYREDLDEGELRERFGIPIDRS